MSDRLYKIIENNPERLRLAIHADDKEVRKSKLYITKALIASLIFFVPLFFAISRVEWAVTWTFLYIVLVAGLANYKPNGWSTKAKDLIVIDPVTVSINGRAHARENVGTFGEYNTAYEYWGNTEKAYGLGIRLGLTDVALSCTFPPQRLFERTEVIRLLNGALGRIPPASQNASEESEKVEHAARIYL